MNYPMSAAKYYLEWKWTCGCNDYPLEGEKRGGYILPIFLASKTLKPFIESKLEVAKLEPIICYRGNQKIHGYEASRQSAYPTATYVCDYDYEAFRKLAGLHDKI